MWTFVFFIFFKTIFSESVFFLENSNTFDYNLLHISSTPDDGIISCGTISYPNQILKFAFAKYKINDSTNATVSIEIDPLQAAQSSFGCRSIIQNSDGGYTATGFFYDGPNEEGNTNIVTFDPNGIILAVRKIGITPTGPPSYAIPFQEEFGNNHRIAQTSDNGYVIAALTNEGVGGNNAALLIKTNADLSVDWAWTLGSGALSLGASQVVLAGSDNSIFVGGITNTMGGTNSIFLAKFEENSNFKWGVIRINSGSDKLYSIGELSNGEIVVLGHIESNTAAVIFFFDSTTGNCTRGIKIVGFNEKEMIVASDGGLILSGIFGFTAGERYAGVFKLSASNYTHVEWQSTSYYDSGVNSGIWGIAETSYGSVVGVGIVDDSGTHSISKFVGKNGHVCTYNDTVNLVIEEYSQEELLFSFSYLEPEIFTKDMTIDEAITLSSLTMNSMNVFYDSVCNCSALEWSNIIAKGQRNIYLDNVVVVSLSPSDPPSILFIPIELGLFRSTCSDVSFSINNPNFFIETNVLFETNSSVDVTAVLRISERATPIGVNNIVITVSDIHITLKIFISVAFYVDLLWLWILIGVGGLLGIFLIGIIVVVLVLIGIFGCRLIVAGYLNKSNELDTPNTQMKIDITRDSISVTELKEQIPEEWLISYEDIKVKKKIGAGGGGSIYMAVWKNTDVVYKICQLSTEEQIKMFNREVKLMLTSKHPKIVTAYGVCVEPRRTGIVMEYLKSGSLQDVIHGVKLSWNDKWKIMVDVCSGMAFLHSNDVFHRDMKSANILMLKQDGMWCAKITDFGLSKAQTDPGQSATARVIGTYEYMPPDLFNDDRAVYTKESDVYSVGVVFWELITGQKPFKKIGNPSTIPMKVLMGKLELSFHDVSCPKNLKDILTKCLSVNRNTRPTMENMLEKLESWKEDIISYN